MTITPDQARELLDGATPGPWRSEYDNEIIETNTSTVLYNTDGAVGWGHNIEHDVPLIAAAPDLAQTIAAQTWQYGAQCDSCKRLIWRVRRTDAESLAVSMSRMYPECSYRLVRRLVGPVEVVE